MPCSVALSLIAESASGCLSFASPHPTPPQHQASRTSHTLLRVEELGILCPPPPPLVESGHPCASGLPRTSVGYKFLKLTKSPLDCNGHGLAELWGPGVLLPAR